MPSVPAIGRITHLWYSTSPVSEKPKSATIAPTESAETRLLVKYGFDLARALSITKVLVHSGLVVDQRLVAKHRQEEKLIWVASKNASADKDESSSEDFLVEVPSSDANRISRVNMGVIMAVFHGFVDVSESVVCLTGLAGSKRLDNLLIVNPMRDIPWFSTHTVDGLPDSINLQVLVRILSISLRLAVEGREGRSLGTIFVLGETKTVEPYVRPLILNPLSGHPQKSRNIHDSEFFETLRELASMDGAFVISPRGIAEHAAVYLNATAPKKIEIPKGLGARHMAAAAITAVTDTVSVVISESSGRVAVFCRGQELMILDGKKS